MSADIVVDVGNTSVKWGRCGADRVTVMVSLPPEDPYCWERQLHKWGLTPGRRWVLAGVHPARRDTLAQWLRERGEHVRVLESPAELPLEVALEHPERAGIDRLLNAVAANMTRRAETPAVIIDAGSAVTVDYVDEAGAFRGGAILPGFRLMSHALHDYTALLPLVEVTQPPPALGLNTVEALESGIFWSVLGGVDQLLRRHQANHSRELDIFLTGGDASRLATELTREYTLCLWPQLTLEGIRLSVAGADEGR